MKETNKKHRLGWGLLIFLFPLEAVLIALAYSLHSACIYTILIVGGILWFIGSLGLILYDPFDHRDLDV